MLNTSHRHGLAIVALLFVLLSLPWWLLLVPDYGEICHKSQYTSQKECTTYDIALVVLWHIGEALNYYSGAILAIVTTALAIYTYRLWRDAKQTSERQADDMRESLDISRRAADAATASAKAAQDTAETMADTAERQLRAYVRAEMVNDLKTTPVGCVVDIYLKNSGQTPAYNVRCWAKGRVMGKAPVFDESPTPSPPFVIHPDSLHTLAVECNVDSDANWKIKPGETLYVWGEVSYEDAIRKQTRRTSFRLFLYEYGVFNAKGDIQTMRIWRYADEGNSGT